MISNLRLLFEEKGCFMKFKEIDFTYLNSVYASPEQIYGIAIYETEKQLLENWEQAADEFAVKIQSHLKGPLKVLRWDMYLILMLTQGDIQVAIRKKIENDRLYFRKIILSEQDYPFTDKLPFLLNIDPNEEFLMFNDLHFLQELKQCLTPKTVERIGQDFFEGNFTEEDLYKKFMLPYINRGEKE
jgi:hypothetical protein